MVPLKGPTFKSLNSQLSYESNTTMTSLIQKISYFQQFPTNYDAVVTTDEEDSEIRVENQEYACIVIQCWARKLLAKWHVSSRRMFHVAEEHGLLNVVLPKAAIIIQRYLRRFLVLRSVCQRITAAMVIARAWRRYELKEKLKKTLRRVERPCGIVLRQVSNIPFQHVHSGKVKVRVSMWWTALLHIVIESDFSTIVQSKAPNFVYTTAAFAVVQHDAHGNAALPTEKTASSFLNPSALLSIVSTNILSTLPEGSDRTAHGQARNTPSPSNASSSQDGNHKHHHHHHSGNHHHHHHSPTSCSLGDLSLLIPGCHGDSVIRFEFLDEEDDRKIGSVTVFFGSKSKSLFFWGGSFDEPLTGNLFNGRNVGRKMAKHDTNKAMFLFDITTGIRSSWSIVQVMGNGPLYTQHIQSKGWMFTVIFKWQRHYLSLLNDRLLFFESRSSTEPYFTVMLVDITSITTELGEVRQLRLIDRSAHHGKLADSHDVIITTEAKDKIHIRMAGLKDRKSWVSALVAAKEKLEAPTVSTFKRKKRNSSNFMANCGAQMLHTYRAIISNSNISVLSDGSGNRSRSNSYNQADQTATTQRPLLSRLWKGFASKNRYKVSPGEYSDSSSSSSSSSESD